MALAAGLSQQFNFKIPYCIPPSRQDTVTVMVIGDVMMHSRQMEYDVEPFLREISPALRKANLAVANMEFSLGGEPWTGYPSFSAPDWYADYVRRQGVDVFLCANNHILDRGLRGLERTIGIYRSMEGVRFTGVASDTKEDSAVNPLFVSIKGIKLALVNFTYGTNGKRPSAKWPKVSRMERGELEPVFERAHEADFVVALPHWGVEYELRHSEEQEKWAGWMVEKGADVIVGAHPHVIQDTTHIGRVPVIYSVGNAVSNMSAKNTRLELAVELRFVYDWRSGEKKMLEPEIKFLWCCLPGMLCSSYCTIFVDEWIGKRDLWIAPSDYDNMITTLERVKNETGIR